jgi:hypothetical protein
LRKDVEQRAESKESNHWGRYLSEWQDEEQSLGSGGTGKEQREKGEAYNGGTAGQRERVPGEAAGRTFAGLCDSRTHGEAERDREAIRGAARIPRSKTCVLTPTSGIRVGLGEGENVVGRIAGEKRGEARVRRLFDNACQTLALLMTDQEIEPAVRLRAASVVFRALVHGVESGMIQRSNGERVTWEEYVKGVRDLDQRKPANERLEESEAADGPPEASDDLDTEDPEH